MNFAPFSFLNSSPVTSNYIPLPETTNLIINVDANSSTSYPGSGATWFDLTANGYNATLINGPTYTSGTPSSINFDGVNDYATFTTATIGSNTSNYSFGGWIKPTTGATEQIYITRGGGTFSLMLNKKTTNILRCAVVAAGVEVSADSPTTFTHNVWTHIYGVWTNATSVKLYINGALVRTTTTTRSGLRNSTEGWGLGRYSTSPTLYWNGSMGNANVYNVALTDAQILNNYNTQKSMYGF